MRIDRRGVLLAGLALTAAAVQLPMQQAFAASASQTAAAVAPVERLNAALLDVMKNGESLRFEGRYAKLQPVLAAVFDVTEMTRVAVGPAWSKLSDTQQSAMVDVFSRYMTTMYAARFKGYGGEAFAIGDAKQRDGDKVLVLTTLTRKDKEPVELSYLMRGSADTWHIVDVYYNGAISQLAQLRSEFSAPLRDGGIDNLHSVLEQKIRDMQGGT
ncbi:MAG TPA: ABC transporter substrate-binding protein [Candidatus Binatia bacterium]|nr:ABC transporter substrate-binding protein [Candidatus Binatia bacterium]